MAAPERSEIARRPLARDEQIESLRSALQSLETREVNVRLFTRSIAHDFNNILTGILGHASLIRSATQQDADVSDSAAVIEKAAERARELIIELLDSTRGEHHHTMVLVDLHDTIREVTNLLRASMPSSVRITLRLHARTSQILGDPGQLHHMLLNLALNARDAMPNGGELLFETSFAGGSTPSLRLVVSDSGIGIPAEIRDRIFEPAFTTKSSGGSGMGLAIVQRVVRFHGGRVKVESEPGEGSRFLITLPLSQPVPVAAAAGL